MEITDKLLKQITETKYLSVDNTDRYRTILRFFYLCYEKLKYWIYQEEVYGELIRHEYFQGYTVEQCQQDLAMLVTWKNLETIQDTRKVASIEEFKNKKYRYQLSGYTVEIERLVTKLENLSIEGASLEPTLLERMKNNLKKWREVLEYDMEQSYAWWNDLNNDFIRLNQNYQDYIRDLNSVKAEEMMKTKEFLVFKDKLIDYLRSFVKSLQQNVGVIEGYLIEITEKHFKVILDKVVLYELSIPRIDIEVKEEMIRERHIGRLESLREWFVAKDGKENEAGKLFDATNEIIRKITRYATQISDLNGTGANRKEEYAKVASVFLKCRDINEAHKLSAMVFGVENTIHLKGEFQRETDSSNSAVFDEKPEVVSLFPRIRNYREKAQRSPMVDRSLEKAALLKATFEMLEQNRAKVKSLVIDNKIDFTSLPVLEPQVRETLLIWLSNALENKDRNARTEDGENYHIELLEGQEKCRVECTDGIFTMPPMKIIFDS